MVQNLSEAITLITDMINAGSLADPVTTRNGDYAFTDELRLSGQFPKVFVKPPEQPARTNYSLGQQPEYEKPTIIDIFFYTKLSRENTYSDSLGSYKNESLVIRFQELIENMIQDNVNLFHTVGFHNLKITSISEVVPYKSQGLFGGVVTISLMTRKT